MRENWIPIVTLLPMCKSDLFLTTHHSFKPLCNRQVTTLVVPGRMADGRLWQGLSIIVQNF